MSLLNAMSPHMTLRLSGSLFHSMLFHQFKFILWNYFLIKITNFSSPHNPFYSQFFMHIFSIIQESTKKRITSRSTYLFFSNFTNSDKKIKQINKQGLFGFDKKFVEKKSGSVHVLIYNTPIFFWICEMKKCPKKEK